MEETSEALRVASVEATAAEEAAAGEAAAVETVAVEAAAVEVAAVETAGVEAAAVDVATVEVAAVETAEVAAAETAEVAAAVASPGAQTDAMMMPPEEDATSEAADEEKDDAENATSEVAEEESDAAVPTGALAPDVAVSDVAALRETIQLLTQRNNELQAQCDALDERVTFSDSYTKYNDFFVQPPRADSPIPSAALPEPLVPIAVPAAANALSDVPNTPRASRTTVHYTNCTARRPLLPSGCDATGVPRARLRSAFDTLVDADDVQTLVQAIGTDVTDMVLHHRKRYLLASGMSESEAAADIDILVGEN